jgi:dihydroxy-acid dehydratase
VCIDATKRTIDAVNVSAAEWAKRRALWRRPHPRVPSGYLAKYVALVGEASHGCLTDPSLTGAAPEAAPAAAATARGPR